MKGNMGLNFIFRVMSFEGQKGAFLHQFLYSLLYSCHCLSEEFYISAIFFPEIENNSHHLEISFIFGIIDKIIFHSFSLCCQIKMLEEVINRILFSFF